LSLIEGDRDKWQSLHITIVPDGDVFRFPLGAALCPATGRYLYEQVASVSYGLSLQSLLLQRIIELDDVTWRHGPRNLQGVLFANADGDGSAPIPSVATEARNVVMGTGPQWWWVHGENRPNASERRHYRNRHASGNLLWTIGHGDCVKQPIVDRHGTERMVLRPGVLFRDGWLTDSEMVRKGYDFRTVWLAHFSCCLLGSIHPHDDIHEVEGFLAAMTMLGCRRTSCAIWKIADVSAAAFAKHWMQQLNQHVFGKDDYWPEHAFATSLKSALNAFRQDQEGRYDHEYYWAPYVLYGPG
jgi:hypothetical protein